MTSFQIGAALAPAIEKLAGMVTQAIVKLNAWIEQNRQVIVAVAKIAVAMIAGGIALMVFGGMISGLGIVLGKLAATITMVGTVLKTLVYEQMRGMQSLGSMTDLVCSRGDDPYSCAERMLKLLDNQP